MSLKNGKNAVQTNKTSVTLPMLLLGMAGLQLVMSLLWLTLPNNTDNAAHSMLMGMAMAGVGMVSLWRAMLPLDVRLGIRWVAGVALLGIPALAVVDANLHTSLLSLPYIMSAVLLVTISALVSPD